MDNDSVRGDIDAKGASLSAMESACAEGDSQAFEEDGTSDAIQPVSDTGTRLRRRLKRAHKLEDIKWSSLDPDRYVPRAIALLRAIAFGEDDENNPVGVDRLQYEALKDYLELTIGDLPSFSEKVLKDDFVASVFESAAAAIRSAFGDLPDFTERMRECAVAFYKIVQASGVMDT